MARYLTVNYERSNFSVAQSIFPEAAEQKLTSILSSSEDLTPGGQPQPQPPPSQKLSPGAIAGIAVAIAIVFILAFGTIFFIRRRRRRGEKRPKSISLNDRIELGGIEKPAEADSAAVWKPGPEMEGDNAPVSLQARTQQAAEFPGSEAGAEVHGSRGGVEMEGGAYPAAVELDAGPVYIHEAPSPDTITREESIPSSRGTPLPRSDSRRIRLPPPLNLPGIRLQSADSKDISSPSSNPAHPSLISNPRDTPQPEMMPAEADTEARRERTKREKRSWRRRREE